MKEYFELKIPSNPKMMCLVRKAVSQACKIVGFAPRDTNAITLAVDEGCTNIIRHCYCEPEEGEIVIRVRMFPDKIVIMLRDFGEAVDLEKLRQCVKKREEEIKANSTVKPGGLGMFLIHSTMDEVKYKTTPNSGTVLKLVKYLSKGKKKDAAGKSPQ